MAKHKSDWKVINGLLRDWHGENRASLEMLSYLPQGQSITDAVDDVMNKFVDKELQKTIKIKSSWPEIAGSQIAAITRPHRLDNKTLLIELKHPAWRQSINDMSSILIEKINILYNKKICNRIAIIPFGRQSN